jgi:hypothetical protein
MTDSRYPYTHSCDFIRGLGPVGSGGVVLSRSDASQIRQGIAGALGPWQLGWWIGRFLRDSIER